MFGERVSEGERTASLPVSGGREVMRLWRAIDSMQRQLEGRPFVELFAADMSHELKNPVAAIRASAEVIEEGAIDDPAAARRFVGRIREARSASSASSGAPRSGEHRSTRCEGFASVDVARLAAVSWTRSTNSSAARIFRPKGIRGSAGTRRGSGAPCRTRQQRARPLRRLVARARRRHARGNDVVVRVENLAPSPLTFASGRFADSSPRGRQGRHGLGLAIARAVAEAHGGRAELSSTGPPKVEFRLRLPAARG